MKFEDIRKKYSLGSSDDDKKATKKESSTPKSKSSFDDIRKKYGLGDEKETETEASKPIDLEKGKSGWQKYLDDQEAKKNAPKYDLNNDGKDSWWEKALGYLGGSGGGVVDTTLPTAEVTQTIHDLRADESHKRPKDDWDEMQKYQFGELYLTDPLAAYSFAEKTNSERNKTAEEDAIDKIEADATSNGWAEFGHTAGAIATAPLGLADFLNDLAMSVAGREIAPDGNVSPFEYSQAVTGGISEHLNEKGGVLDERIPIIGGKGWGDAYGLGTSIAQSWGTGKLSKILGAGSALTLISYLGQGAASGVDDAIERGATEEQAIKVGIANGLWEAIPEALAIEKLFGRQSASTVKGFIKSILSQAGTEGLEELATSVGTTVADLAVMQDKSNFSALVEQYMALGLSKEDAEKQAWKDLGEDVLFDAFAGAISGGISAGLEVGGKTVKSNVKAKKIYGNRSQELVDDALASPYSSVNAVGQKFQKKLDGGKQLSGWNINELIDITDNSKLKSEILRKLGDLGETHEVVSIADVLVKYAEGEKLSSKDISILNESDAGYKVLNGLNPYNIKSGGLADKWAETIGTRRVNPEVYNKPLYDLASAEVKKEKVNVVPPDDDENSREPKFKVSESGNTIYNDGKDHYEATIKGIASTEGGIKLELDNGKIVNASDVEYGSKEEAMMYETVAEMGATPETANEVIKAFKPSNAKQALRYMAYVPLAYKYGTINYEAGLKNIALSNEEKRIAFNRGRMDAITNSEAKDKAIATKKTKATKTEHKGIIFENGFTYDESTANEMQKVSMAHIEVIEQLSNLEVHVFESIVEDGERVFYLNGKRKTAPNGFFTDGNKIYIDFAAGDNGEGAMLHVMSHEIGHYIRRWNAKGFKEIGDFLIAEYGKMGIGVNALIEEQKKKIEKRYKKEGMALPGEAKLFDMAYEELVADAMSDMLTDPKAYEKLAKLKKENRTLWEKLGEAIKAILDKFKAALGIYKNAPVSEEALHVRDFSQKAYNKLQDLYIKAFVKADANYEAASGDGTVDLDGDENVHLFSDRSIIEGAGLQFILNEDGVNYNVLDKNGMPVKEVTAEMIVDSPLGNLVTMAKNEGFLGTGKEATKAAQKQYEFLAELVNMCINYNGIAPIWETAGTMVFSSMKSNADKQYGLTVDFSTVCKKTQAIVDAMSEAMLRLGRGLNRSEVEAIYLEVGKAGESTPCPVCYVFSRWMGIGGILDQISRFQDKYASMSEKSLQKFIADIQERIRETANTPDKNGKLKSKFFNAKGEISEGQVIAELKSKASNKAASALKAIANNANIQLEIQELEVLMEAQDAKDAKKTADKIKKLQKKLTDVSSREKEMHDADDTLEEYEAYQWLTRTLMMESEGRWIKNSKFKPVPKKILFDLNKGDVFAEDYPLSWAFRTGKGASAGKAIVPYADARVGEAIQAVASQGVKDIKIGMELNPFLNSDTKGRLKILKSAIAKQARQNLVGGQRYQSTSDFRYEYGSDYLITFLEMQAIGAKVQLYTKVIEAVDFLASMGADCNLSVMPLSDGFITLPNGEKKLVYSSVTGINAEAAIKKSQEFNNVQLILVGISDEHIRLALEGTDVTFVIPFHGSGNSVHQIQALMNLLGENLDVTTAQDYTAVQSDHVSPHQTKEQKAMWNLRVKIIQGKASTITAAEQALLDKNSYLKDLYRRFYLDQKADEYGVGLTTGQAEQIFPYEYWDKSLTYAEADKNGERFKEYCASMGIIPRFSGMNSKGEYVGFGDFTNDKGYWKLLIDRPMYDNTYDSDGNWTGYGKYHEQARINCSNFQVKHLDPEYGSATYGEVMSKANDPKKTNKIVDAALKQFENNTLNDVRFSDRDSNTVADDFLAHIDSILKGRGSWYTSDVVDYIADHPELDFVTRIFAKDKAVKGELDSFLGGIDNIRTLERLSWFIGEAYGQVAPRWGSNGRMLYPYQGAVRTFRNAIKRRTNAIMTAKVNGTNLELKNGASSLEDVKGLFNRLNSNEEIGEFAEKVFATAEKLGVNIRFVNQLFQKGAAGDAVGDMVEYKTSYFNDTAISDQRKATVILHELIHSCTVYVLSSNTIAGDVYYRNKSQNYENIANAATRLNRIFMEIKNDINFKGEYGTKDTMEMVAELANEKFVSKLKQKNLWQQIVDWICELFGIKRGTSAYENAKMCVDYIIDNPEISEYKAFAKGQRRAARGEGMDVFGKTIDTDGDILYSDRVLMGSLFSGGGTLEAGLVYQMVDKEFAVEYNKKIASVYTDNHGREHMFVGDVRDFNSKEKQNVFYLHASPVCKNFSPASHSGGETTLDITTAQATARVLEEQMPQVFTVENVKRYIGSEAYTIITDKLDELGYTWDVDVYKASDYGNATKRERMILRAVKDGHLPEKPQKASKFTSWGEATRDLWETDLIPSNLVKSKIEAIKNTPQLKGVKLTKLDKPLMIYDTTKSKTVAYAWADELSPTLTTKCGDARIIMPDGRVYAPTPKFMGRIQGLPDDYKYPKAVTNAFKIIGNGIPTQLTKAVMGGVLDSAYEQTHDGQVLYSDRVTDQETLDFLNKQLENGEVTEVYRAMTVDEEGNLYPPMAGYVRKNGKKIINGHPSVIGEWEQSTESIQWDSVDEEFLIGNGFKHFASPTKDYPNGRFEKDNTIFYKNKNGEWKAKFHLDKDNGSTVDAAYAPYIHTSLSVLNDQFTSAYTRENLVVVRGYVPNSEVNGVNGKRYQANFADKPVGKTKWHSGVVAAQMPETRTVILSRYFMPIEIVDDSVVAQKTKEMMKGNDIEIPYNVITPRQRRAMEAIGIRIGEARGLKDAPKKADVKYSDRDSNSVSNRSLLANALESVAKNDIEKTKLTQYKQKIALIESEQAKLAKIRAKIKELSFAKGARDTEAIKKLQFDANQIANRINTYDKQLLNLESTTALKGVLEREKTMLRKRLAQKEKETLAAYREKAAKTQRELMERYQESRKRATEGRHKTEERHAIKALKEKFMRMLENPTERQYVPASLISAMVDVCQLIDTDTDLYKPDGSINKAQQARNEQMQKLLALRDEYAKLGNHPDPMYKGEFDEEVLQYLDELRTDYAGKSLSEMTLAELKELRITLRAIEETLRDARKLIGWGEAELVYDAAEAIITGQKKITEKRKGKGESTAKAAIIDNSLSPLRNINRMVDYDSNSPLVNLFREIELGVRKKNKFAMDAHKSFEDLTTGNNAKKYEDAIYKPHGKEYVDKEGRKFRVSKMEKMQAIMSYDRELSNDKLHHVSDGGFTFADIDLLNKGKLLDSIDPRNAHSVTFGAVIAEEFRSELANDAWAQEYMMVASQFFDETAKKAINDANMLLKHRLVATGSKYIPYEVNKDYVVKEITSENDIQQTISGYGMLKDLKEGATQPLIITGLNNILERHIDQVSNIHGLAVPIRNFNKVWNVKSLDGSTTVNESIGRNWGNRGKQVMIQAVKDVQGARISHRSALEKKLKSNVIGATFTFNGSVVTKQIGSLFAATAKMQWRNPASMIANLIYTMANHKKIAAEVDKYTASAWMRRQGMSDAELYTLTTEARKKGFTRLMSKLPTFMNPTKWITGMDSMVALSLWKYAKADVAKQTGLEGEELLQAAAEYYDDIIENTQSMSDALHRPEIQKRDDLLSDVLGTFKTDLYQGAGLLRDALGKYKANKTKENAANLAKAITANVMSALWGSVMTSVFALLRYKVNRYRDDEDDELEAESWLSVQGRDIIGDMIGYAVPLLGGEVADIVIAIINGDSVDSFDNLTLNAVNDLISSISGIANAIRDKEMPSKAAFQKFITSIASAFSVPANNVARLLDAIKLHAEDIANGEFLSFEAGLTSPNSTRLYNAYIEGDADKIEKASRLFKDESAINSAIRKALRENDPRIKEAAQARYDGDIAEYKRIAKGIIAEGNFSQDTIISAINSEITAIKKGETTETKPTEDTDEESSIYKASDINVAFENGDSNMALEIIDDLVRVKMANGMTEKEAKSSLRSSMTSYWKPLYKEAFKSGATSKTLQIRRILLSSGLYGTSNEVVKTTFSWLKD